MLFSHLIIEVFRKRCNISYVTTAKIHKRKNQIKYIEAYDKDDEKNCDRVNNLIAIRHTIERHSLTHTLF